MAKANGKEQKRATPELPEVPTFTIRADSAFGLYCMFMVARAAAGHAGLDAEDRAAIDAKAREFDLYEEAVRTQGQ